MKPVDIGIGRAASEPKAPNVSQWERPTDRPLQREIFRENAEMFNHTVSSAGELLTGECVPALQPGVWPSQQVRMKVSSLLLIVLLITALQSAVQPLYTLS